MFHLQNRQTCVSSHGEALRQPCLKYSCRSAMENVEPLIKVWPLQGHIANMQLFRLFIRGVKEIKKTSFTNFFGYMASNFSYRIHLRVCLSPTWIYHWHPIASDSIGMLRGQSKFYLVFKSLKFIGRCKSKHSQNGGEWSASHSGHFTPGARAISSYWTGGWVDPDNLLDTWGERKSFASNGSWTLAFWMDST